MNCSKPRIISKLYLKKGDQIEYLKTPMKFEVPCGKCLLCRISKSKEWAVRVMHEIPYWSSSTFVTLTYSDDHIPPNRSLVKKDLQLFFKRLRKKLDNLDRKIKYYACGEYGESTDRPHYHAIIFGVDITEKELLTQTWVKGFVHTGSVSYDSARYVAQYIDKKYSGVLAECEYEKKKRSPPFQICSGGLGLRYCNENAEQLKNYLSFYLRGVSHGLPRYYKKKLGIDSERLEELGIQTKIHIYNIWFKRGYNSKWLIEKMVFKARQQSVAALQSQTDLFRKKFRKL